VIGEVARRPRHRALLALALSASGCFGAPGYEGPVTAEFDGERFHDTPPTDPPDVLDLLRWKWNPDDIPWTHDAPPVVPARPPPRVERGIRVTFVNHATVLVQMDGKNLLTDPVWANRVGPVPFAGPSRWAEPGVRFEDLPRIDAVLLSHSHYDHCDVTTLARLERRFGAPVLAGLGSRAMLAEHGVVRVVDLDRWQAVSLGGGMTATFVPARHWSQRGLLDRNTVLWGGFFVRGPSGAVLFAGDSGFGGHFAAIRARLGPPDVALLPIGAYAPRWHMANRHMSPSDAVRAHLVLGARQSVGIHWGTFDLADEGRFQPAGELGLALDAAGVSRRAFLALPNGGVVHVGG
jgi:L-ascorbate metabolism protein UlaG (beta-lactamase superfamily)